MNNCDTAEYLCAQPKSVYGDSFSFPEIERWYAEEENGYANLDYLDSETDCYPYHLFNEIFGWNKLQGSLGDALSLGGAFAAEYALVSKGVSALTVIEPSKKFWRNEAYNLKLNYVMPNVDGHIDYPDGSFDTITVFGVLHHIPNVSYVFSELVRILKEGGYILVREPIISMGDWSKTRNGLTKNERGIPLDMFVKLASENKLETISSVVIGFPPLQKICTALRINYWDTKWLLKLDALVSKAFLWNYKYHRSSVFDRFSPSNIFLVFRKKC